MKLHVLLRARRDLDAIYEFVEQDDLRTAKQVANMLLAALRLITTTPMVGIPLKGQNVREWSVSNLPYVIPYRIKGETIEILRVYHTRRKRPANWQL